MSELTNRKTVKLADQAREMAKLTEHPAWPALRQAFAEARAQAERKLVSEMMRGGEGAAPLDQRKVDYRRGFLRGCQAVLDHPELAIQAYESAMEKEG